LDSHSTSSTTGALWDILLIVVLTLMNACFSMAETALVSLRPSRVEQLIDEGKRGAKIAKLLVENPPRFIATTQVGITILGFGSAAAASTTLAEPLVPFMTSIFHLGSATAHTIAVVLVTLLAALLTMVLGEIAPKSLAVRAPDIWALRLAPFVNFCASLFTPITWLVVGLSTILVRPFGAKAQFETPHITRDEYEHIISNSEKHGELDEDEADIISNVFEFSETPVTKVMTARTDMTMLRVDANLRETLELILKSGHSRIPVYEGTPDNIVGILHAKDLLPQLRAESHDVDLRTILRAPYIVPGTKSVKDLLDEFRRANQQLAIVLDDSGGTDGLVTVEDLLEEIVGPIGDEFDVDEPTLDHISPNEAVIDGRMGIDDVNDRLNIELPSERNTIGGLVFALIGHSPSQGDRARLDGIDFVVERTDGHRIKTIRVILHQTDTASLTATIPSETETPQPLIAGASGVNQG
jgi:putative hemolysin